MTDEYIPNTRRDGTSLYVGARVRALVPVAGEVEGEGETTAPEGCYGVIHSIELYNNEQGVAVTVAFDCGIVNQFDQADGPLSEYIGLVATEAPEATVPGVVMVNGNPHRRNSQGLLAPDEMVSAEDKLEDEVVRKVVGYAEVLSAQIARFREHTFDDIDGLVGLLQQEYGDHRGGVKGNITLTSFDGLLRVKVAVADLITFGPTLQVAKNIFDECLTEWATTSRPEIRALIQDAFSSEQEGKVSRSKLIQLKRLVSEDERWKRAVKALVDSIRVTGSKRYVQIQRRPAFNAKWEAVSIDMASA